MKSAVYVLFLALSLGLVGNPAWSDSSYKRVPYGGDHQTYDGTKIYRIGDYSHRIREFQDAAIINAVDHLLAAGIARPAIRQITIEPDPGAASRSFGRGLSLATTYNLWVKVAGCESNIFMRAATTGRLTSVTDRARCLTG